MVPSVEKSGILAGSWMSSKWPHRAPADRVLMRAFVGGARDPRALERSDAELVEQVLASLRPLLGIGDDPLFTKVYRWERAGAQHEVGHASKLAGIARLLGEHQGIFLTGSAYRGVGIPDCVADGRATGKQVTDYLTNDCLYPNRRNSDFGCLRLPPNMRNPRLRRWRPICSTFFAKSKRPTPSILPFQRAMDNSFA